MECNEEKWSNCDCSHWWSYTKDVVSLRPNFSVHLLICFYAKHHLIIVDLNDQCFISLFLFNQSFFALYHCCDDGNYYSVGLMRLFYSKKRKFYEIIHLFWKHISTFPFSLHKPINLKYFNGVLLWMSLPLFWLIKTNSFYFLQNFKTIIMRLYFTHAHTHSSYWLRRDVTILTGKQQQQQKNLFFCKLNSWNDH